MANPRVRETVVATAEGSTATVTIIDGVVPDVTVTAFDAVASEVGPNPGTFRFSRTGSPSATLTITYCTSGTAQQNGADYLPALQGCPTITFGAGQATVDLTITPVNDALVEGPRNSIVDDRHHRHRLRRPGTPAFATVTIGDQPVPARDDYGD